LWFLGHVLIAPVAVESTSRRFVSFKVAAANSRVNTRARRKEEKEEEEAQASPVVHVHTIQ
jgi:hypothetical protein